jgi:hypothetical protein
MSLRTRARRLQRATGLSYQQALTTLRKLGAAPAQLHRQLGWPLGECDLYLTGTAERPPAVEIITLAEDACPVTRVCAQLLVATRASAVSVSGPRGEAIARVGSSARPMLWGRPLGVGRARPTWPHEPMTLRTGPTKTIHLLRLRAEGTLAVVFSELESSVGWVELRAAEFVDPLVRALHERRRRPGGAGTPAAGGNSGAPFGAWLEAARGAA